MTRYYPPVRATRDFSVEPTRYPCSRCGILMSDRSAANPQRMCLDCHAVETPIGTRTRQRLDKEERENPEKIAAFMEGVDWWRSTLTPA